MTSITGRGYRQLPVIAMGCDECERRFEQGAEVVVVYEDDGGLHPALLRYSPDAGSLLFLAGLNFHRACYETARVKDPPLPPLDSSG